MSRQTGVPKRAHIPSTYCVHAPRRLMTNPQTLVRRIRSVENTEPNFDERTMRGVSLPAGFVMLFDSELNPIAPANDFMRQRCVKASKGDRWRNTQAAYADDLANWWTYLAISDVAWGSVQRQEIADYASSLEITISQVTREHYAGKTIARRVGTVIEFYRWAFREGLTAWDPGIETRRLFGSSTNHDASRTELAKFVAVQAARTSPKDLIEPADLKALRSALGPSPYEDDGEEPGRDRLMMETALLSGMRVEEVCGLTIFQIHKAKRDADRLRNVWQLVRIYLPVTKGNTSGVVHLPAILIHALHKYMIGRRAKTVSVAKERGKFNSGEPTALFLNDYATKTSDLGEPVTPDTAMRALTAAVKQVGLLVSRPKFELDPDTGCPIEGDTKDTYKMKPVEMPAYSYHKLRHTFAVTYEAMVSKTEPASALRKTQARLRHKNQRTTELYLRGAQSKEPELSDQYHAYMLGLSDERRKTRN